MVLRNLILLTIIIHCTVVLNLGYSDPYEIFESKIRPILVENCFSCHGEDPDFYFGGLDVGSIEALLEGGDSGPLFIPGDPEASLLMTVISYKNPEMQMPPDNKIPDEDIQTINDWIANGAITSETVQSLPEVSSPSYDSSTEDFIAAGRDHWAYLPIINPSVPSVNDDSWGSNSIDSFVLSKLEENSLTPSEPADRRTWLRRITFDVTGLPPTLEEINNFLNDTSTNAPERVVERLLQSPRFGERWGRHWLDVVRYADSNGNDENIGFPNAFRYRDYVIRSFNEDKPYDEFIREQLAGDLIPAKSEEDRIENFTALGYLTLGSKVLAEQDLEKRKMDIVDEQIDVIGKSFLGQTISCARCHDHKFDPISAADYYAMAGIFSSIRTMDGFFTIDQPLASEEVIENHESHYRTIERLEEQIDETRNEARRSLLDEVMRNSATYLMAAGQLAHSWNAHSALHQAETNMERIDEMILGPAETEDAWIHWTVTVPDEGRYMLSIEYASFQETEFLLTLNNEDEEEFSLPETTSEEESLAFVWEELGEFDLRKGENILSLKIFGETPWVRQYSVLQGESYEEWIEQRNEIAEQHGLNPVVLHHWVSTLNHLSEDSLFSYWNKALLGSDSLLYLSESASQSDVNDPIIESLISPYPPVTLMELAQRYQILFSVAHLTRELYHEVRFDSDEEFDEEFEQDEEEEHEESQESLHDLHASLEPLWETLYGDQGLLSLSSSLEGMMPDEVIRRIERIEEELDFISENEPAPLPMAMTVKEDRVRDIPIHIRGNHLNQASETTPRGFLQVLDHLVEQPDLPVDQSGRLELAQWITDKNNPLTARVMVNRIWKHYFGKGLVTTPNTFGLRGAKPTHPLLLDYLASVFMENDWSMKSIHRMILLSSSYAMESTYRDQPYNQDPANTLLWRMQRKRLEVEPIRDALLFVSGQLDHTMYGRLDSYNPDGYVFNEGRTYAGTDFYTTNRRSIYLPIVRNSMYPMFAIFDYGDSSVSIGSRPTTVVAPQSLYMMNSPMVMEQAKNLASLLKREEVTSEEQRIELAFERLFSRLPSEEEEILSIRFIEQHGSTMEAWEQFCHSLIASNEMIYIN